MKILVLNCGSSSVKYSFFDMDGERVLASGILERIGLDDPRLKHKRPGHENLVREKLPVRDHTDAIRVVLDTLLDPEQGVIGDLAEINAVGHRVVHGGERFAASVLIDEEVMAAIRENSSLAPLHNPPNIAGIEAVTELLPDVPQVAVFDTAFHQTMPPHVYLYAIPARYYRKYRIRRYGFHGTSHRYVSRKAAEYLGRPIEELKIVTCHLGNGASIAAVKHGRSVDTSMGFTPLEGLPMGTRCGDIDPAIVYFLMDKEGLSVREIDHVLNRESGVLGLSEQTSDMRFFEDAIVEGPSNPHYELSMLVVQHYGYRIKKYIGAYAAAMGGVDAVVFTGGVGENFPFLVEWVSADMEFLGIRPPLKARRAGGEIVEVTPPDSPTKVLMVPTDEELVIARDTYAIVRGEEVVI